MLPMRVGLVLGAGGVVGASWLIGALDALEAETGWRAVDAERIVGTSAGAVVGALAAGGIPSEYMSAYASGRTLDGFVEAESRADALSRRLPGSKRLPGSEYRLELALPPIGPGSWRLALTTIRAPAQPPARRGGGRLAATRLHLHGTHQRPGGRLHARPVARPPELLGGRRGLQLGQAGRLRPRRRPDGGRGRRRRGVMRHPRLLPPGDDRRAPLRRRRHLLDLEPRPAVRRRPRPRRLPEPDVLGRPRGRRIAGRPLRPPHARGRGAPPGPRGPQAPRRGHQRAHPAARR